MEHMQLWEFRLKLENAFLTPWQADILFGHLAWTYRELHGEDQLSRWLQLFLEGQPPYVFSDGFLPDAFPRPLIAPPKKEAQNRKERIEQIKLGKKRKKMRSIHEIDFKDFLQGREISFQKEVTASFTNKVLTHNVINRETGRSLDSAGLYEIESTYIRKGNTISIYARVKDQEALEELKTLLEVVSLTGYGKKKGIGFGHFSVQSVHQRTDLDVSREQANGVVWMSYGVPDKNDPTNGWYKLETKYGKIGGMLTEEKSIFKRPLTRILPGAVFKTEDVRPYYGKMVQGISLDYPNVVQYGYALALPISLPAYILEEIEIEEIKTEVSSI